MALGSRVRLDKSRNRFTNNLPAPGVIAQEIVAGLEAAREQFRELVNDLGGGTSPQPE